MVWGCFSAYGTGKGRMNGKMYRDILEKNLLSTTSMMKMKRGGTFQQDKDPKHTAKETLNWFQRKKINLLEYNPIENLWEVLNFRVHRRGPQNLQDLSNAYD